MNTKVKFINKIICILIITIIVWNISLASYAAMTTYSNGIRLSEMEQEKSKLFLNTEFTYGKYNNTNKANTVFQFLLPAETSLNSSNTESYNDIVDVGDGLVVVGDSYISKYEIDSKYYKENYLNKAKGNQDAIILKYDYNLNMKSFETFGGGLNESFKEIYQTKDGGYLAFGQTCSTDQDLLKINYNTSSYQDMAVKYDKNFNVILAKVGKKDQLYKENESQIIENKRISNGQIILNTISDGKVGVFTGVNGDEMNSTITKYDNVGHIEWAKTFDRNSKKTNDNLKKYVETNDAYIFVGSSSTKVKNKYNQEITVQDAIIVKYNKPYDQIIINGIILEMNIGTQRKADVFYIPWEDVTIGEMNWISENEDVATVDYKGNITAQKEGITKIHLDVRGKKATCTVTVKAPNKYTLKYNILDEEKRIAEVTGIEINSDYDGNVNVDIPKSIVLDNKEYKITQIGDEAFKSCYRLKEITMPDSVNSIGLRAFWLCNNLTKVIIPSSVTSIRDYAFLDCKNLTNIEIPSSVTNIGEGTFQGCSSLTKVTIPEGITKIEDFTFNGCSELTEITIPESVINIGENTFFNCSSLTNITIPKSVTSIGEGAFCGCSSLTDITIPNGVTNIEMNTFSNCSSLENISIPSTVINIENRAFYECTSLSNMTIPESVTNIGDYVFSKCGNLENITMPKEMDNIGEGAFSECSSLTNITIPRINEINRATFRGCSKLTDIIIPDCVFYICYEAFSGCSSLNDITIPNSVNMIWDEAFAGCENLKNITIPDSVNDIGNNAFENCNKNLIAKIYKNSYAHHYLEENNIKFEFINIIGDVDGNGEIDAQDAVMILKYVAHNIELDEQQLLAANTTKDTDGTVDAQDAVQILKYVAHNISEF